MAVVSTWGDMSALPSSGASQYTINNTSKMDVEVASAYVTCFGSFSGFGSGTVSQAIFDTNGFAATPDIFISGLSFSFPLTYFNDVLDKGNLAKFLQDLLGGDDTITSKKEADTINLLGFAGNDTFICNSARENLFGGATGQDTASYASAGAGVIVVKQSPNFNTGAATGDTYDSIENITGSRFSDTIYADDGNNKLSGLGGNDTFVGLFGNDRFDGGTGTDTVSYDASAGGIRADLLKPSTNTFEAAGDTYISIENLDGSSFGDTLLGNNANNVLRGSSYPNLASGADKLLGLGGNDTLHGFDNNDTLTGGLRRDILFGEAGADKFDFNTASESPKGGSRDRIMDFSRSQGDKIDLKDIDAKSGSGNQTFAWIGKSKFHDEKGELRYDDKGSTVIVQGDTNGDGKADFEIFVNAGSLSKGDFFL